MNLLAFCWRCKCILWLCIPLMVGVESGIVAVVILGFGLQCVCGMNVFRKSIGMCEMYYL